MNESEVPVSETMVPPSDSVTVKPATSSSVMFTVAC